MISTEPGSAPGLCGPFVAQLPITGASICVFGRATDQSTVCTSDALATELDVLQFDLAEGPRWEVARTGSPVLNGSVGASGTAAWPVFAARSLELGVGALFAFPLMLGSTAVGVVDLYRTAPGLLSDGMIDRATELAAAAAAPAFDRILATAGIEHPAEGTGAPVLRRAVHQATGMVLIQLDTTPENALAVIRAHAFATDVTVDAVAQRVIAGDLDFRDELGGFGSFPRPDRKG